MFHQCQDPIPTVCHFLMHILREHNSLRYPYMTADSGGRRERGGERERRGEKGRERSWLGGRHTGHTVLGCKWMVFFGLTNVVLHVPLL